MDNIFPDENLVKSSSFDSQMKMDDQNAKTEEEEKTVANIVSGIFT